MDAQLSADHQPRWLKDLVDQMDLTQVYADYSGVGTAGCDPRCLLRMVL